MIVIRIGQLAEQLGVHRNTIRNWIKSGKLPARAIAGKRYLVSETDFKSLCREFDLDRAFMKIRHVPGGTVMRREHAQAGEPVRSISPDLKSLRETLPLGNLCLTCGSCASGCPISGVDGLDPRKIVRMAVLGLDEDLLASLWPWKCTLCGKCEESCPMNVEIVSLLHRLRGMRDRSKIPGSLQKGVELCLTRGNNLGIPKEDFLAVVAETAEEMVREGFQGFTVPVDVKGANLLVTVNSTEPFARPEEMTYWWKIFWAAQESWTIPSEYWDGVNWGLFTGDDAALKTMVGRLVDHMYRLECKTLLLPE